VLHEYAFDCFDKVLESLNRETHSKGMMFQLGDLDGNMTLKNIVPHTRICDSVRCGNFVQALEREHPCCMDLYVLRNRWSTDQESEMSSLGSMFNVLGGSP